MDEVRVDVEVQKLHIKLNALASIVNTLIKSGSVVAIVYLIYKMVYVLSGKTTNAYFWVKIITSISVGEKLSYLFGTLGILYGIFERRLRKNKVKRLSERIKTLEQFIDKKRTSSMLNTDGELRKGEEL